MSKFKDFFNKTGDKISDWTKETGDKISNWGKEFIRDLGDTIWTEINETPYQSRLEVTGIAIRQATKQRQRYHKSSPYADAIGSNLLRLSTNYIAASGWVPSTYDVKKTAVDRDFENVSKHFSLQ